jgi:hypothetical protein
MASNIRAFPPSPAALLGAMTGGEVKSNSRSNRKSRSKSKSKSKSRSKSKSKSKSRSRSKSRSKSKSKSKSVKLPACALLLLGAPVQRRRAGGIARRGARTMRARFRQYTDVLSKTPPDRRGPAASSRARTRGRLSLAYFSLATQREVSRLPLRQTKPRENAAKKREKPRT